MRRPRDERNVAQDMARNLADIAAQLGTLKGEANAWLSDESYDPLRHRLENAHAAVGVAAVEARSIQPTRGYPGGSRMTTGIGRSVRFW
jgi:hypothetical protein